MTMLKKISAISFLSVLLTSTASSSPWSSSSWGNSLWDDNDWSEWTPMYWMKEMFSDDDDDFMKNYYRYRMLGLNSAYPSPYTRFSPYQSFYSNSPFLANQGLRSMMPMSSFGSGMNPWQMYSPMNGMTPWSSSPFSGLGSGFPMQSGMFPMMSPMGMGGMNPMTSSMFPGMGMGGMNPMNAMTPWSSSPFSGFGTGSYFPRF